MQIFPHYNISVDIFSASSLVSNYIFLCFEHKFSLQVQELLRIIFAKILLSIKII